MNENVLKGDRKIINQLEKDILKYKSNGEWHNILLKRTCLILASEHKKTCENSECQVRLHDLIELLKRAGIKLTKTEERVFL